MVETEIPAATTSTATAATTETVRFFKHPTIFEGLPDQEIDRWLEEYVKISGFNKWNLKGRLFYVPMYLAGIPKAYYHCRNMDKLETWELVSADLKKIFTPVD